MEYPAQSSVLSGRKPTARSRVTNGRDLLPNTDGRTMLARRYRDIMAAIASDQGGVAHLSEARIQLVRRFVAASCMAEEMESKLVSGESINMQEHAMLCSTLVRLAQRIGIDRRARNVVPALSDYLGSTAEPQPEEYDE